MNLKKNFRIRLLAITLYLMMQHISLLFARESQSETKLLSVSIDSVCSIFSRVNQNIRKLICFIAVARIYLVTNCTPKWLPLGPQGLTDRLNNPRDIAIILGKIQLI